jgi:DNA-binding ferritin-like protein (Dps family)
MAKKSKEEVVKIIEEVTGDSIESFIDDVETALGNLNAYEHDFESSLQNQVRKILKKLRK